jgi:manganese/zinc/iron transport system permease protein
VNRTLTNPGPQRRPGRLGQPGAGTLWAAPVLAILTLLISGPAAQAARIGELSATDVSAQAARFFTFADPSTRWALAGALLLGLSCGLLGGFLVVRKLSLVGDALSHAVLPGVAAGFLWSLTKNPLAIFVGATAAALLGALAVEAITRGTRLPQDTALGLVLSGFFAAGICMVSMIQRLPTGSKSGIDKFLFGQAAAIGPDDLVLLATVAVASLAAVLLFHKELLATSFDPGFAAASGLPARWIHRGLMVLLACAIVVSLQAVGVVLVSAMLIIPAATAYLLTDRMHRLLMISAAVGMVAGATGAFCSFLGTNLPTGPFMVLAAGAVFALAWLFGPRHGVLARQLQHRRNAARTARENTLKSVHRLLEQRGEPDGKVTVAELAQLRKETPAHVRHAAAMLRAAGLGALDRATDTVNLTPEGRRRAAEVVRNHRLWELYLANAAHFATDHVHEDAEEIEHVLGEETVRLLEARLQHAERDPHGRLIPRPEDPSTR